MALVSHSPPLPSLKFAHVATNLSQTGCSRCLCWQLTASVKKVGELCEISVGSQTKYWRTQRVFCHGWQVKGSLKPNRKLQSKGITGALPTAVTAAGTAVAVGAALFALTRLNKVSIPVLPDKKECEICGGSGVCPTCRGEGFINRNLSEDASAKARANAKDAATRYTAGLARKWNYCTTCAGQRGCQSCDGRGWVR